MLLIWCVAAKRGEVEIAGPLHLSSDGRFLAVVLKGAAGVLLCDAGGASLQPLARLAAGQAEPPSGVTILPRPPHHCMQLGK